MPQWLGMMETFVHEFEITWSLLGTDLEQLFAWRRGPTVRCDWWIPLSAYGAYLYHAQVPDAEWDSWPTNERAERILIRLGEALPALNLFRLPALASVLGVVTHPPSRPDLAKTTGEQRWDRVLEELLVGNLHWASDHGALADIIAGKRTVHEQIDTLVRRGQVRLRSSDGDGAESLERFCRNGDDTVFGDVEWVFHEDPGNRRSRSMGLYGLLIARGRGEARVNPIDRLANETEAVLGAGLSAEERAEFRRVLDTHRQTGDGRAVIVGALTDVAGEEPANQNADWGPLGKAIAAASRDAPEKARALAERWAAIDATETTDIVTAPSLLLGLARLIARDDVNVEGFREDDLLALTLVESERADTVGDTFQVDASLPDRLHHFLWDKVRDALVFDTGEDDEDDDQALELMSFVVARRGSGRSQKLGTIRLEWLARERRVPPRRGRGSSLAAC